MIGFGMNQFGETAANNAIRRLVSLPTGKNDVSLNQENTQATGKIMTDMEKTAQEFGENTEQPDNQESPKDESRLLSKDQLGQGNHRETE
jgi:hypothetical protein